MAYLTAQQATQILENEGNTKAWYENEDDQDYYVQRATRRIEAVPFANDTDQRPRFVEGHYSDASGNPIADQPMPQDLQHATAILARWYAEFPDSDKTLIGKDQEVDNALSPWLADLPLSVQSVLMNYAADEIKPTNSLAAQKELRQREQPRQGPQTSIGINYVEGA